MRKWVIRRLKLCYFPPKNIVCFCQTEEIPAFSDLLIEISRNEVIWSWRPGEARCICDLPLTPTAWPFLLPMQSLVTLSGFSGKFRLGEWSQRGKVLNALCCAPWGLLRASEPFSYFFQNWQIQRAYMPALSLSISICFLIVPL